MSSNKPFLIEPQLTALAHIYDIRVFTLITGYYYWILSDVSIQVHKSTSRITNSGDHISIFIFAV